MGQSLNKVILIGHLGGDPETNITQNGRQVTNFSLATQNTYTDGDNNKVTNTEWHRITVWNKLAEIADKYLKKGSLIYVEGKIQYKTYVNKKGETQYSTNILVNTIKFLDSPNNSSKKIDQKPKSYSDDELADLDSMDDIPF